MAFFRRLARRRGPTHVSAGLRIYAVGDIHGRLDLLDDMMDRIDADVVERPHADIKLVFLGDYVDRGRESAGVLFRLLEISLHYSTICLKGNHEAMMLAFLGDASVLQTWAPLGGLTTLQSYGLAPRLQPSAAQSAALARDLQQTLPADHLVFLKSCPLPHVSGDYVFVHAGLRPRRPIGKQIEEDLLWIRDDFTLYDQPHEKFVVHGHTPVMAPDVRTNRINIDTGAYATGRLTCLVLEGDQRRFVGPTLR